MKPVSSLALFLAAASAASLPFKDGYNLTLVLAGEGENQYWLLTEENYPAGVDRTRLGTLPVSVQAVAPAPTYHGTQEEGAATPGSLFQARDAAICDYKNNRASTDDCSSLLSALNRDLGPVPASPRNIRYNNCYISWSKEVTGGEKAYFYNPGVEMFNSCNKDALVSARKPNTAIYQGSMTVCLSNRANHCS